MKPFVFLLFLLFNISISWAQEVLYGKATNVYDGDTFTLVTDSGESIKIRVEGIDAPEKDQPHGIIARDFARSLLDGKTVRVYILPGETYGRKLGIVITPSGKHINYEMVVNGHAWHYTKYNSDKYYTAAQVKAKKSKLGLWAQTNPQAPWEWRRNH